MGNSNKVISDLKKSMWILYALIIWIDVIDHILVYVFQSKRIKGIELKGVRTHCHSHFSHDSRQLMQTLTTKQVAENNITMTDDRPKSQQQKTIR